MTQPTDPGKLPEDDDKKNQRIVSLVDAQAEVAAKTKAAPAKRPAGLAYSRTKGQRIPPLVEADAVQEALYAKRQYVYPRQVRGFFASWRATMVFVTLGIYYLLPWVRWGTGRQAFLIDLPGRKFNLFLWTFWPQDLFYLTTILILSALSLFLFTAIAGRLWCGYTCPQTVWTEVFLWIERKFEGDRAKQMKLAGSPWTGEKIAKKGGKHAAWIAFAAWTGFTFVGYFTPIRELAVSAAQLSLGPWETFWILFYGFATYGNAGWLREQVCLYMCPYARFQGAMFDKDTLIISYDAVRGEPRGSRKRGEDAQAKGLGDCIDCTLCVQVCPTGIDIRNGLQVGCIACAACIDVCETVMDKMNYPRGLIRYTTENELTLGKPRQVLRPRVLLYSGLLGAIAVGLVIAVLLRIPLDIDVIRDRNSLYRETQGLIENVYTLKLMNMDTEAHTYLLSAEGLADLKLRADRTEVSINSGEVVELPVTLTAPPESLSTRSEDVRFVLQAIDDPRHKAVERARFLGPGAAR